MENNLPIVVFNMVDGSNINRILSGSHVGTLVKT
jgi:uridylate kinase